MPTLVRDAMRRSLDLPPPFDLITLREAGEAFAHAKSIAATAGAGALIWTRRFDLVEFAVVLEPEQPLAQARLVHYACMNALADALSLHCPPEKSITFSWPDTVIFDAALLGGGCLAWPEGASETEIPSWLVFGVMLRADAVVGIEAGLRAGSVSMAEAGFVNVDAADIVESFARHLMAALHDWTEKGAKWVALRWLDRIERKKDVRYAIDKSGDLLMRLMDREDRSQLSTVLQRSTWMDVVTGEPRL